MKQAIKTALNCAQRCGCPTDQAGRWAEKHRAIVAAATDLFSDKGFGAVSMDEVAKHAGVSKRTVYGHFGSKEELFAEVMTSMCELMGSDQVFDPGPASDGPDVVLRRAAARVLSHILSPRSQSLFRIVMGEIESFPNLGRTFFDTGPGMFMALMTDYFATWQREGVLVVDDPEEVAGQFFGALEGDWFLRSLTTGSPQYSDAEITALVDRVVDRFLYGVTPRQIS